MLVAVVPEASGGTLLCPLGDSGRPVGPPQRVGDPGELAAAVAARERADAPRWLWPATAEVYPALLRHGVRVARCHDVELTEALLLGHAGHWGRPRSFAAAWARLTGAPVPPDPPPRAGAPPGDRQGTLFDDAPAPPARTGPDPLLALLDVYADQLARIADTEHPARFRLLVAAESAGALVAAELGRAGLPWRADVHDGLLLELLGAPSPVGGPPHRLVELAAAIAAALGRPGLHPESPGELLRAFRLAGIDLPNTRAWSLRGVDHPAVPLLLEYKELYRIWTAHGWAWRRSWVRDGRFRPEYVPAGVVSGRWATRGGGALQIPRVIRRAVVADPGWRLVVADAGQLEPRVLAAVSGDTRLAAAGAAGDLYAALATDAFGGDRARAKVAMLGAMYGQTGGAAVPALATLRRNYPAAFDFVERAARTGEAGGLVRSWLGRTCPPAVAGGPPGDGAAAAEGGDPAEPFAAEGFSPELAAEPGGGDQPGGGAGRGSAAARARGRFTRNFVVQATAAEWASTLLALLRGRLAGGPAELVFFQHDEVIVHCPAGRAGAVAAAVLAAGEQTRELLFPGTAVRFPLATHVVECYADAK